MHPSHSTTCHHPLSAYLIACVFGLLVVSSVNAQPNQLRGLTYFEGTFAEMQQAAVLAQQPYLLYFYTPWAPTCQEMEQQTFNYDPLRRYLSANYLVFRINAEASRGEGQVLAQTYNVKFYPTVIICGPDETVLGRFSGAKEPQSLLNELTNYHQQIAGAGNTPPSSEEFGGMPDPSWDAPAMVGEPVYGYATTSTNDDGWDTPASPQEDVLDLPTISAYGVQVGAYQVEANARAVQTRLRTQMQREILVRETNWDGRILYKVIIGPFWQRIDARQYQNSFRERTGKDCIIIEYQP